MGVRERSPNPRGRREDSLTRDARVQRLDDYAERLSLGVSYAELHVFDAHGLPTTQDVRVAVELDYYSGTSDGFAGFGTMCPMESPAPQSPTTCF